MAESRHALGLGWYSPDPRAILPLDAFHCPGSVRRVLRAGTFDLRRDTAFEAVIRACAEPRDDDGDTWINDEIIDAYVALHRMGVTHSVEAWRDDHLVGGLYGVSLGSAFFAESMFHRADLGGSNASKVCVAYLVDHLVSRGYSLLDVQMVTPITARLGAVEISRRRFLARLRVALATEAQF